MSNPLEMLEVINENDNVVGLENRAKIHQEGVARRVLDKSMARAKTKKQGTFFLLGVLPSKYSGRWRNNADEVLAKLFFGEERICQNFG